MNYTVVGDENDSYYHNTTSYTDFDSDLEQSFFEYNTPDKIVLICIYVVVFFLALLGNTLVLVMICFNRSVRRNTANYFLVNLAIADLLVTLFCIPFTVAKHVYTLWVYGEFMCRTIEFMQGIYVEGSVLTMLCMSAERYLAIRHPMKMRTICNERRIKQVIILTWIIAMIIMCPLIIYKKLITHDFGVFQISFCREVWPSNDHRLAYDMFLFIAVYIIPGSWIVILYTLIGCSLCKPDYFLQRANSCISNEAKVMNNRKKLAKMMVVLSILFAIFWMPYFIITICLDFKLKQETKDMMLSIYPFALLLGHSNSAKNPILYYFMHRGFHDFISVLVKCQCSRHGFKRTGSSFSNGSSPDRTKMESIKRYEGNQEEKKRLMVQVSQNGSVL